MGFRSRSARSVVRNSEAVSAAATTSNVSPRVAIYRVIASSSELSEAGCAECAREFGMPGLRRPVVSRWRRVTEIRYGTDSGRIEIALVLVCIHPIHAAGAGDAGREARSRHRKLVPTQSSLAEQVAQGFSCAGTHRFLS